MNIFRKLTWKSLSANKSRTAVTIVGVTLSVAMLTGILVFAGTFKKHMRETEIISAGDWHGKVYSTSDIRLAQARVDKRFISMGQYKIINLTKIFNPLGRGKHYLRLVEFDDNLKKMVRPQLISGRMPKTPGEIVLPDTALAQWNHITRVGDVIKLPVGKRVEKNSDGGNLIIKTDKPYKEGEHFKVFEEKQYVVVGISKKVGVEGYDSPVYIGFSVSDNKNPAEMVSFFKVKPPKRIYSFMNTYFPGETIEYNENLLIYSGGRGKNVYSETIFLMCAGLIVLIGIGSVALMYNAFSISTNERMREFGLLSAIGATGRQLRRSVFYESAIISAIGIPVGVAVGIGVVAFSMLFTGDFFRGFSAFSRGPEPVLYVNFLGIAMVVVFSFLVVLVSAAVPALRVSRTPVMDALKQQLSRIYKGNKELKAIKINDKMSFEVIFARKSYQRNRRKYRATVISLVLSITLFVLANFIGSYFLDLEEGVTVNSNNVDLTYIQDTQAGTAAEAEQERVNYEKLSEAPGIKESHYLQTAEVIRRDKDISKIQMVILEDYDYDDFIDRASNEKSDEIKAVLMSDEILNENGNYYKKKSGEIKIDFGKTISIPIAGEMSIGAPLLPGMTAENALIISESYAKRLLGNDFYSVIKMRNAYFTCKNADKTYGAMRQICRSEGLSESDLNNPAKERKIFRNMVFIINVIAYGFVILISLVGIANIFNTISANIAMRRRELALIKAVGMDKKSMAKMMRHESMIYGARALSVGLSLSIVISVIFYFLLKSFTGFTDLNYIIPISPMVTSTLCVLIIVLATMSYAIRKVDKGYLTDELKNENM